MAHILINSWILDLYLKLDKKESYVGPRYEFMEG